MNFIKGKEKELNEKITGCILAPYGMGKTSLLKTLDPETTLFVNIENGDLSVLDWIKENNVLTLNVEKFLDLADLVTLLNGPNLNAVGIYGKEHYNKALEKYGDIKKTCLAGIKTIFIDSLTYLSRLSFEHYKNSPLAVSEKTGKLNLMAVYGLHGEAFIKLLIQFQNLKSINTWFVCATEEKRDDAGRKYTDIQIDGQKGSLEMPGVLDEVFTLMIDPQDSDKRVLICKNNNDYGVFAKDRSSKLNEIEPANLTFIMNKLINKKE